MIDFSNYKLISEILYNVSKSEASSEVTNDFDEGYDDDLSYESVSDLFQEINLANIIAIKKDG